MFVSQNNPSGIKFKHGRWSHEWKAEINIYNSCSKYSNERLQQRLLCKPSVTSIWALDQVIELGPRKEAEKPWSEYKLNPRPPELWTLLSDLHRWLIASGRHSGAREFDTGRTNTQGLWISEEKGLPL